MAPGFYKIDSGISSVLNFKPDLSFYNEPDMRIAFPSGLGVISYHYH
jgi:hypothetical protein